jgi:Na+-translocating membrane potential-generating system (MpsC)
VRTHLIESARPRMEAIIQEVAGVKVLSLHHDISTATGKEVMVFTLARSPECGNGSNGRAGNPGGTSSGGSRRGHRINGGPPMNRGPALASL